MIRSNNNSLLLLSALLDRPLQQISYPPDKDYSLDSCRGSVVAGSMTFIVPTTLMIASTFWAFKTRNLPERYSEIKSIGATMYITVFVGGCAIALALLLKDQVSHIGDYIIGFAYQFIAFITLVGQYAMKVKSLYNDPPDVGSDEDRNRAASASQVTTIRTTSPPTQVSEKRNCDTKDENKGRVTRSIASLTLEEELDRYEVSIRKNTILSNKYSSSPKLKRFSIDLQLE